MVALTRHHRPEKMVILTGCTLVPPVSLVVAATLHSSVALGPSESLMVALTRHHRPQKMVILTYFSETRYRPPGWSIRYYIRWCGEVTRKIHVVECFINSAGA